jgi:hypothetical protein
MTLGPIAFLAGPWLLAGLLAPARHLVAAAHFHSAAASPHRVPADPHPRVGIENREETPAQTPW